MKQKQKTKKQKQTKNKNKKKKRNQSGMEPIRGKDLIKEKAEVNKVEETKGQIG